MPDQMPAAAKLDPHYADYVFDQLQQTRLTQDHAAMLHRHAPARIAKASEALSSAGHAARGSHNSQDDTL
ncbi:hypothetical protein ABTF26_22175, partial [Acinetobacter baumannii]